MSVWSCLWQQRVISDTAIAALMPRTLFLELCSSSATPSLDILVVDSSKHILKPGKIQNGPLVMLLVLHRSSSSRSYSRVSTFKNTTSRRATELPPRVRIHTSSCSSRFAFFASTLCGIIVLNHPLVVPIPRPPDGLLIQQGLAICEYFSHVQELKADFFRSSSTAFSSPRLTVPPSPSPES